MVMHGMCYNMYALAGDIKYMYWVLVHSVELQIKIRSLHCILAAPHHVQTCQHTCLPSEKRPRRVYHDLHPSGYLDCMCTLNTALAVSVTEIARQAIHHPAKVHAAVLSYILASTCN